MQTKKRAIRPVLLFHAHRFSRLERFGIRCPGCGLLEQQHQAAGEQQARAILANTINREAAIMAYNQVFFVMGIFLLIASALMLLLKQPAPRAPDAAPVEA